MPRDLLDLARERRERLLVEIAELDRFIAAGEALRASEQDGASEENSSGRAGTGTEAAASATEERPGETDGEPTAGDGAAARKEAKGASGESETSAPQEATKRTKSKGSGGRAAASARRSGSRTEAKKSSRSEAPARRSRDQILADAQALSAFLRQLLSEASGPVPTATLFERVAAAGHRIGGQKPLASLAAKLSRSSEFNSVPGEGWTLAEEPRRGEAESGARDEALTPADDEPRPDVEGGVGAASASDSEGAEPAEPR